MSNIDLDAMRKRAQEAQERADKATPRPWIVEYDTCDCGGEYGCSHGEFPYVLLATSVQVDRYPKQKLPLEPARVANYTEAEEATSDDAEFMAASRDDVPALAADVLALANEVERLQVREQDFERIARVVVDLSAAAELHARARDEGTQRICRELAAVVVQQQRMTDYAEGGDKYDEDEDGEKYNQAWENWSYCMLHFSPETRAYLDKLQSETD